MEDKKITFAIGKSAEYEGFTTEFVEYNGYSRAGRVKTTILSNYYFELRINDQPLKFTLGSTNCLPKCGQSYDMDEEGLEYSREIVSAFSLESKLQIVEDPNLVEKDLKKTTVSDKEKLAFFNYLTGKENRKWEISRYS